MKGNITKSELKIMNALWENGTLPLSGIVAQINMSWKNQTTLTLITRLEGKGYISHVRAGRQYLYTALCGKEECLREGFKEFMADWKVDVNELLQVMEGANASEEE